MSVATPSTASPLALRVSQLAAFLVPGVALSLPSGYSVGATVLALAAIAVVLARAGKLRQTIV